MLCAPAQAFNQIPLAPGPEVSVDGTLGIRCSARSGSSPSVFATGGTFDGDSRAMVGVVIPLHPSHGNCSKILSYEEAMGRLLIAEGLLERGLITPEDYKAIADEVHAAVK